MESTKSERAWATYGKIAAIPSLALTLMSIWTGVTSDSVKISAQLVQAPITIPPGLSALPQTVKFAIEEKAIETILSSDDSFKLDKSRIPHIAYKISNSLEKSFPRGMTELPFTYSNYCLIDIANEGHIPAEQTTLSIPFDSLSQTTKPNQKVKEIEDKRSLYFGTINPGEKLRVELWMSNPPLALDLEKIVLSHKIGTSKIQISRNVFGFFAWADKNSTLILIDSIVFPMLIIPLLASLIKTNRGKKRPISEQHGGD